MKHFLHKSLLTIALLLGGVNYSWAYDSALTTMTGRVGLTDNSSTAFYYASKPSALADGDTYVYTFVNNNGGSGELFYNWILEVHDGTGCFDLRADGGNWIWGDGFAVSSAYSGNTSTDVSDDANTWLTAYNGVTVTLTVSRSGSTITATHSATTNNSTTYSGTISYTYSGGKTPNVYITNEASYQDIQKVVYTNGDGGTIYVTPEHTAGAQWGSNTGASTVDAEKEHYNNDASSAWAGCAYAKFSFSELPDGISISSASVTYSVNQGGKSGRDDIIYYMAKDFDINWASFAGQTGTDLRNTSYRAGTAVTGAATGGTGDRLYLNQSVTSAVSAMYEAGQNYILFQWTGNAGGADLYGKGSVYAPCLSVSYTKATLYTATFTETNSLSPTVTIYSDSERTIEVVNGALADGTTYYYRAVLEGFHNYDGSFTVDGAEPNVEFEMTAKTVYNYSVNAIDGESGVLKSSIVSGTCYADETTSFYLPECVLVDGTLYFRTAEDSYKSVTVTSNNQVFTYAYTTSSVDNVVFFVEGESISGASTSTATNNQRLASNGYMGRGSNLALTTLPIGSYTIYVHYINTNKDAHTVVVNAGETAVINNASVSARPTINGSVTLTESMAITLTAVGSSTSGVDYIYIVQTAEVATISSLGWSTLYSPYALDFSDVSGLTAYTASVSDNTVTLTEVSDVPANTGVVLHGTASTTYNIPVITSSSTDQGDLTGNAAASTAYDAVTGHTYYVLAASADANYKVQFRPVTSGSIAAGKAFLDIADASVKSFNVVFDLETGINAVNNGQLTIDNSAIYNLAGQRLNRLQKGINIVNGKKIIK